MHCIKIWKWYSWYENVAFEQAVAEKKEENEIEKGHLILNHSILICIVKM